MGLIFVSVPLFCLQLILVVSNLESGKQDKHQGRLSQTHDSTQLTMFFNKVARTLVYFPSCNWILSALLFRILSKTLIVISCDAIQGMMADNLEQRQEKPVSFPRLQASFYCFLSSALAGQIDLNKNLLGVQPSRAKWCVCMCVCVYPGLIWLLFPAWRDNKIRD